MNRFKYIIKIFFLSTVILFSFLTYSSSQPSLAWVIQYNGPGNSGDEAAAIALDDSGNVYVTGKSAVGLNYDYATIKYNSSGAQQWAVRYNGPGNGLDYAVAICLDKGRNVYVTGSSTGSPNSGLDFATIKYNNSGIQQWVDRYSSGSIDDKATSMFIDEHGNLYVAGSNSFLRTIKYDSSGNMIWISSYDGPSNGINFPNAITTDIKGNILVTGYSDLDYVTIKYNPAGVQLWVATYNDIANGLDYSNAIVTDSHGNVYITGSGNANSRPDWVTIKYNSSGAPLWVVRNSSSGESIDRANDLSIDSSGNIIVTGSITSVIKLGSNTTTIKYSSDGSLLWRKEFDSFGWEAGIKVASDKYNNIIVLCRSNSDFVTLKYNSLGQLLWSRVYGAVPLNEDGPADLALDTAGNIFETGYTTGVSSARNYVTIKYSEMTIGINPLSGEIPKDFILYQNYPNPFNPETVISYDLPSNVKRQTSDVKLIVYNMLGKEIATLVNEKQNAGSYSVEFNGTNYPSGIYYYHLVIHLDKLEAGEFRQVKKMILIK